MHASVFRKSRVFGSSKQRKCRGTYATSGASIILPSKPGTGGAASLAAWTSPNCLLAEHLTIDAKKQCFLCEVATS